MDDARYDWLMLVPMRPAMVEIHDLDEADQVLLWQEVSAVSQILKQESNCKKVNVGALGNIEPQLHVHLIARNENDPAWPGPVWGAGVAVPYETKIRKEKLARSRTLFVQI